MNLSISILKDELVHDISDENTEYEDENMNHACASLKISLRNH